MPIQVPRGTAPECLLKFQLSRGRRRAKENGGEMGPGAGAGSCQPARPGSGILHTHTKRSKRTQARKGECLSCSYRLGLIVVPRTTKDKRRRRRKNLIHLARVIVFLLLFSSLSSFIYPYVDSCRYLYVHARYIGLGPFCHWRACVPFYQRPSSLLRPTGPPASPSTSPYTHARIVPA